MITMAALNYCNSYAFQHCNLLFIGITDCSQKAVIQAYLVFFWFFFARNKKINHQATKTVVQKTLKKRKTKLHQAGI